MAGILHWARCTLYTIKPRAQEKLPKSAYVDNYHLRFGPVSTEVRDRVTQAIVGELTVDKAIEQAQTKAKELLK